MNGENQTNCRQSPEVIEFVEDAGQLVEDVDLARRGLEQRHGQRVWKDADKESSERVDGRDLVR